MRLLLFTHPAVAQLLYAQIDEVPSEGIRIFETQYLARHRIESWVCGLIQRIRNLRRKLPVGTPIDKGRSSSHTDTGYRLTIYIAEAVEQIARCHLISGVTGFHHLLAFAAVGVIGRKTQVAGN
jgi:hypothetical protein